MFSKWNVLETAIQIANMFPLWMKTAIFMNLLYL